jgi:hypothetical protein
MRNTSTTSSDFSFPTVISLFSQLVKREVFHDITNIFISQAGINQGFELTISLIPFHELRLFLGGETTKKPLLDFFGSPSDIVLVIGDISESSSHGTGNGTTHILKDLSVVIVVFGESGTDLRPGFYKTKEKEKEIKIRYPTINTISV